MASSLKNLSQYDEQSMPSGKNLSVGIVVSDWNKDITHALYEGCFDTLIKHQVADTNIHTVQVPGTFELTAAASLLLANETLDAVICIGCVIKGETQHNEYINQSVAFGITQLGIQTGVPVIFGVLTPNTLQQAIDRSGGKYGNKGIEAAVTALRMAHLSKTITQKDRKIGY